MKGAVKESLLMIRIPLPTQVAPKSEVVSISLNLNGLNSIFLRRFGRQGPPRDSG